MRGLKNRIEKLEEETSPEQQQFEEFKIVNIMPGSELHRVYGKREITIRWPVKRGRKR